LVFCGLARDAAKRLIYAISGSVLSLVAQQVVGSSEINTMDGVRLRKRPLAGTPFANRAAI
jgi:hypothetical protein